ncbi:MAG TPA: GNAT family N-acetyltransferase [Mycobacteriales bacterium]|nr:GNAT family N-acetyltransferase [Mycobacteriales bacterium]
MTEYRRPCLLDPALHDRRDFVCAEPAYADWLRKFAGQSRRADTAATWVIADPSYKVVAYATLSMTGIGVSEAPAALAKRAPDPIPALLIGRLAVDERHEGVGLGTELVKHILATAVELNESAALRAVVLTALNDVARRWWRDRLGFVPFDPGDAGNFDLFLLTSTIAATLEAL